MAAATEVLKPTAEVAVQQSAPQVVQVHSPEMQKFEMQQRAAKLFAASGLFSDIKGVDQTQAIAQAFVKIALGDSMGFSPAESMQGIDLIQGRPAIGSQLRAARMQRAGYRWRMDQLDEKGCVLTIFQGDMVLGTSSFVEADAKAQNLLGKDNWKKNPRNMYFARAITNAQRWYAPCVLSGEVLSYEEAADLEPVPPPRIAVPQRKGEMGAVATTEDGLLPGMTAGETTKYPDRGEQ